MLQNSGPETALYTPHTPLWGNPLLPHLYKIPDPAVWATRGIDTLRQVMQRGEIAPFQELRWTHRLPRSFQFRYWQRRHALRAQFPTQVTLDPYSIERLQILGVLEKPLSSLYLFLTVARDVKLTRSLHTAEAS